MNKYNIDIAVISEKRLAGNSQLREEKGGYVFLWSVKTEEEPRQSGIGFAIKSDLASSLPSLPKGVSDRIMALTLNLECNTRVTMVSCYAPTLGSLDEEKYNFYNLLRDVISKVQHKDKLILTGDFNTRVGNDYHSWKGVLGHHGIGHVNSNELRLLTICKEFDLSITNTFYQQPSCRKTTMMQPRSKDRHLIDDVITKRRNIKDFKITRSFYTTCYLSDHALLRSKTTLHLQKRSIIKSTNPKRINVESLKSTERKIELSDKLDAALDSVNITNDIE